MIFTPNFTVALSDDGKLVTFTNTSNFGNNDEGYDESEFTTNELVLKDAYGDILETIPFPTSGDDENIIKFELLKDQWVSATLNLAGVAAYTHTIKSAFYRIYMQGAKQFLQRDCCHNKHCDDFGKSQLFKDAAVDAIEIDDAIEFQENIDSANLYLSVSV